MAELERTTTESTHSGKVSSLQRHIHLSIRRESLEIIVCVAKQPSAINVVTQEIAINNLLELSGG
ncbi:MAG: hypothetical protein ACREQ5_14885, partial [Candidatus Dormibacteria bacterium]